MTEAAISDHGLIGDLQTAGLVSTDGWVDWFCWPRFDSPSVFGAPFEKMLIDAAITLDEAIDEACPGPTAD